MSGLCPLSIAQFRNCPSGTGVPDSPTHLLLRHSLGLDQHLEGARELDGVEIGALHVLDEGHLQHSAVGGVEHHRRHLIQAGELAGPPASLSDDELVGIAAAPNDQRLQDASTREMARRIPFLLSYISHSMTLEPGDIVSTGTPAGVGIFRDPRVFLNPGDEVVVRIEGIGELRNKVVEG